MAVPFQPFWESKKSKSSREAQYTVRKKPRPDYPMARPHAPPPPGSPYHGAIPRIPQPIPVALPAGPPPLPVYPPPAPHGPSPLLKGLLVVMGVMMFGLGFGWYFFKGPGRDALMNRGQEAHKSSGPAPVVAAATPDPHTTPSTVVPPPVNNTPAPTQPMPTPSPPPRSGTPAIVFEKHVLPIFEQKCLSCHGEDKQKGKLDMRTVAAMLKGGDGGPALVRGSPEKSSIWTEIDTNKMPPTPTKLSQAERKIVMDWIRAGAP